MPFDNLHVPFSQFSKKIYIDINSNLRIIHLKYLSNFQSLLVKDYPKIRCQNQVFDKYKTLYEKSLNNSGFYENLIYYQDNRSKNQHKKIKKCQRKIIWFNPPFSKIVKTNIGKKFFKLINRHFPKHHKMSKIFNKNAIKLSYNCCRNMGSVIASHSRRIIQPTFNNRGCNCRMQSGMSP